MFVPAIFGRRTSPNKEERLMKILKLLLIAIALTVLLCMGA